MCHTVSFACAWLAYEWNVWGMNCPRNEMCMERNVPNLCLVPLNETSWEWKDHSPAGCSVQEIGLSEGYIFCQATTVNLLLSSCFCFYNCVNTVLRHVLEAHIFSGAQMHFWLQNSKQEAQLPQRNSASAAHMEGAKPSSPLPPPLATPMRTVESETRNKRICTSSVPSVKRTLSWIGHSRSFNVILICADRNPERCIVVMCN